jgi:hypothetical protein
MMACFRAVVLLAVSSFTLRADLTLKVRTIASAGRATEITEYYKGNLMRREFGAGYQVVDFSSGRSFSVDPEKKEYYPFDGRRMAMKQVIDPAHKILVETACSATGEQRQWFGYTAYRYLTTTRSHDEFNGQSSGNSETRLDTWILDLQVPPHVQGIMGPSSYSIVGSGAGGVMQVPDVKATHSGPEPHGLVVRLKSEQYESEVVALSLAPLDESLFEVPKSFREVTPPTFEARPLSWSDQLTFEWLQFRAWLGSLFGN